jgi:hypothetical protein
MKSINIWRARAVNIWYMYMYTQSHILINNLGFSIQHVERLTFAWFSTFFRWGASSLSWTKKTSLNEIRQKGPLRWCDACTYIVQWDLQIKIKSKIRMYKWAARKLVRKSHIHKFANVKVSQISDPSANVAICGFAITGLNLFVACTLPQILSYIIFSL